MDEENIKFVAESKVLSQQLYKIKNKGTYLFIDVENKKVEVISKSEGLLTFKSFWAEDKSNCISVSEAFNFEERRHIPSPNIHNTHIDRQGHLVKKNCPGWKNLY